MKFRRPSAEQLNVLRWLVAAALAVTYMFTGYEPAFILGVVVLLLPVLLRRKKYQGDEPKEPEEPR